MFKKIRNTLKTISMLEDIDINMSKMEWYNSVLQTDDLPKYTYFAQYHGYTHVVSWGPFPTLEQAKAWVDSTQEQHNISCNIIPALDPKADSKHWPL
jgi:hypothetical protein